MKKFLVWILIILTFVFASCGGEQEVPPPVEPDVAKDMLVHYLNVGQGDSAFIELPNGETMLIDSGDEKYADSVISYISNLGYNTIDYVIATHPHDGHIGGMAKIFEKFTIKDVYITSNTVESKAYTDFMNAIKKEGIETSPAVAGNTLVNLGENASGMFVAQRTVSKDLHENCAVFRLDYGKRSFLFASDAGEREEISVRWDHKCDVLKVANHGGKKSSGVEFLSKCKATIAIISCGDGNVPEEDTLNRLKNSGITNIYRTDVSGNIIVKTDGDKLEVTESKKQ